MALIPENFTFRVPTTLWWGLINHVEFGGEGQDVGTLGISSKLLARNSLIVELRSRFKPFGDSGLTLARQRF